LEEVVAVVNIFSMFVKYLKKKSSTLSYVSNVWRTVSSASKPSAFVGTSFSTGSSKNNFLGDKYHSCAF
jgi:hypothetical protein